MSEKKLHFYILNNCILTPNGMSGSDQRVIHWSRFFKKQGHKVSLITSYYGQKRFENLGFTIINTGGIDFRKYGFWLASLRQVLVGLFTCFKIKLNRGSIIYSSSDLLADFLPSLMLKVRNPKSFFICGLHLLALNPFRKRSWFSLKNIYYYISQRFVILFQKKFVNLILVSNNLDRDFLLSRGFKESQVVVTPGGVDFTIISQKELKKEYEAVWVGRFHLQKGIDDLFSVWRKIIQDLPQAKLLIIGEDLVKSYFFSQNYSASLKNNVFFAGFLQGRELFKAIKKAKVFVFPSYHESFGMVVLEAMACELPVVAYDLLIYCNVWKHGIVTAPLGDVSKLAEEVKNLLVNGRKRKILAREACQFSKKFSWEKTAQLILHKVNELSI